MSQRYDFYNPIHKGLRLGAARLLARIGSLDTADRDATAALIADLRDFLALASSHLVHEDREINGLLRRHAPDVAAALDTDHADHQETFAGLEQLIAGLQAAPPAERAAALRALYLRFTTYVADDMLHMAREEEVALPVFHAHFTDAELAAAEARIIAAIPPEKLMRYLRLMLPAATPQDRIAFLRDLKAGAPPEAFSAILDQAARPSLAPKDWSRVCREFAVAA